MIGRRLGECGCGGGGGGSSKRRTGGRKGSLILASPSRETLLQGKVVECQEVS